MTLYTHEPSESLSSVIYDGEIDYYETMPSIFPQSRINLNITLKTIETDIPLHAWDILGCGRFLLSNFQEELCNYFTPNKGFVYSDSISNAIELAKYYLGHKHERIEIAHNGLESIKQAHTFHHRVQTMSEILSSSKQ